MKAPEVRRIDMSGYHGQAGFRVRIRAVDDFRVKGVTVRLSDANGRLLEEGHAVMGGGNTDWVYRTVKDHAYTGIIHVQAEAADLAGNTGVSCIFISTTGRVSSRESRMRTNGVGGQALRTGESATGDGRMQSGVVTASRTPGKVGLLNF